MNLKTNEFITLWIPFPKNQLTWSKYTHTWFFGFQDILSVLGFYYKRFYLIPKQIKLLASYLIGYIMVLLMFIVFVFVNGSIVVGDKSAHEAALHLPQVNIWRCVIAEYARGMFFVSYVWYGDAGDGAELAFMWVAGKRFQ